MLKCIAIIIIASLIFGKSYAYGLHSVSNVCDVESSIIKYQGDRALDEFRTYWTLFRKAVIEKDTSTIIALATFPIQTRGTFDSDPIIKLNKGRFKKTFFSFLESFNGIDLEAGTNYDFIKNKKVISERVVNNRIRIGDMVFLYIKNEGWRLSFLYFVPAKR